MTSTQERPIIFSGPMARAILEGRKTQTRRVVKPQPTISSDGYRLCWKGHEMGLDTQFCRNIIRPCPYGQPGDRLWVRETWLPWDASGGVEKYIYRSTTEGTAYDGSWKPSIFMPRRASRITLEITGLRVERVQEITPEDALAEGSWRSKHPNVRSVEPLEYRDLWDSINAERGFGWNTNCWVWVIEFKRL